MLGDSACCYLNQYRRCLISRHKVFLIVQIPDVGVRIAIDVRISIGSTYPGEGVTNGE